MKPKFDERGRFANQYTPDDMDTYINWLKEERDINWCIGQIMIKDNISALGAYKRLEKAAKILGRSKPYVRTNRD